MNVLPIYLLEIKLGTMKHYIIFLFILTNVLQSQTYFQKVVTGQIVQDQGYCINSAWGDYDNDGFQDLVTAQCYQNCPTCVYPIYLYHNNGNGTFSRETNNAIALQYCAVIGICWGDYDNDGKLDLFLGSTYGPNLLFHNDGNRNFTRVTSGIVVTDSGFSRSCSWCDYDRDGWLDLFVANRDYKKNYLYHNNGNNIFTKITTGPIANDAVSSCGSSWGDYDNDGWPDLFVVTEFNANDLLYHNNGNGTFTKITSGPEVNDGLSGIQCAWGDYDNDNYLDLMVTITNTTFNRLYHNEGNGNFTLSNAIPNVVYGQYCGSSWGDYNNDGFLDHHIGGYPRCYLYKSNTGVSFTSITNEIVANELGQDASWSDVNNDGKMDLFVNYVPTNRFYLNIGPTGNYLICKLKGCQSNRAGIGTRIIVKAGSLRLTREVNSGDGNENMLWQHFGLGTSTNVDSIIVYWPYGVTERKQVLRNIAANQSILIDECLLGTENNNEVIPEIYRLYQNYPNPFNPATKIKYDLPRNGNVILKIFDVLGSEIVTIENELRSAGSYETVWNASNYPSGIYFARLTAGEYSKTIKMILIK